MVSTPLKFLQKYFRVSLARSTYYLKSYIHRKTFVVLLNSESLALQIFPVYGITDAIWSQSTIWTCCFMNNKYFIIIATEPTTLFIRNIVDY